MIKDYIITNLETQTRFTETRRCSHKYFKDVFVSTSNGTQLKFLGNLSANGPGNRGGKLYMEFLQTQKIAETESITEKFASIALGTFCETHENKLMVLITKL